MNFMPMRERACWIARCAGFMLAMSFAAAAIAVPGDPPTIVGFNLERGGTAAIGDPAAWVTQLRGAIIDAFPGAEFRGVSVLNAPSLAGAQLLILSSAFSGGAPITPLSAAEVNALRAFVVGGGSALLFVDADTPAGWDAANESLINAFGIDVTGTAGASSAIDLTVADSPIIAGRFGSVASISFITGGWFNVLGPDAQCAGIYPGTQNAAAVYIPEGALGAGSGLVVAFADTTMILDGFFAPSNRIAVMNVIGEVIRGECRADFDASGEVNVPDIFAFLSVWFAGDIVQANYNGDAFLNTVDVFAFLTDWFAGC